MKAEIDEKHGLNMELEQLPADTPASAQIKRCYYEAHIGLHSGWNSFYSSYEDAFNLLFTAVQTQSVTADRVAYPMLYLARHSLELGYKNNINRLAKYSGLRDGVRKGGHSLKDFHGHFGRHFRAVAQLAEVSDELVKDFERRYRYADELVNILHKLDERSDTFRYPLDNNFGRLLLTKTETIDLFEIKNLHEEAMVLLSFSLDVLSGYTDYVDYVWETQ